MLKTDETSTPEHCINASANWYKKYVERFTDPLHLCQSAPGVEVLAFWKGPIMSSTKRGSESEYSSSLYGTSAAVGSDFAQNAQEVDELMTTLSSEILGREYAKLAG